MNQRPHLFLASLFVAVAIAGCAQSAVTQEGAGEEDIGTAEQAVVTSGFFRTYYSDSTYTVAVGTLNWDCIPDYREQDGDTSNFYKQYRYDCPGFNDPTLPACDQCVTWTVNGQSQKSCYVEACSVPPPW